MPLTRIMQSLALVLIAVTAVTGCAAGRSPASPSPGAPPPASPPAPGQCDAAQLTLELTSGSGSGAANAWTQRLVFTNHGGPCNLRGFPAVTFTDRSGRAIFTAEHADLADGQPSTLVHLSAGGQASARFSYTLAGAGRADPAGCPRYAHTTVTAPGATGAVPLPSGDPGRDQWECATPASGASSPAYPPTRTDKPLTTQ